MDAADRHVLDVVPVGLQVWEATGGALTLRYANEEAKGQMLPSDAGWADTLLDACEAQQAATFELEAPGDEWWRAQITPLGAGSILAAYWNITAQKLHERSLRASERLNREILSGLQEGVVVADTEGRVVVANEAAAVIFGVPLDELTDRTLSAIPVDLLDDRGHLLPTEHLPLVRALRGEEVSDQVVRFVRRDGSLLWVEVHANPLHHDDGQLYGAVASYDDVTARVEQDRRTRHEADTDPLTGLANRRALERTLAAALGRAGARARSVGLLMLDLDGFKAINDTHGHAAGDEALREVARRLSRSVRERDLVARLGGDEFVVVLTDLGGRSGAVRDSLERIQDALAEPIPFAGANLSLGAAVGVATFPADGGNAADLLAHADRAMYAAKGARNGSLR
ncbi:diguanylate cyclase domain-containing protein [Solirubrobacter ginsenosidimutans]|uniref:diguanylate cyclase domain-containing protein n=1 Tax=Solirubrobacter ginsenosidimutans TaxID=490573 RepID=UPI0022CE19EB|nr:diguanylate cyclase [Solirubrobacter ginsenosidimutans]